MVPNSSFSISDPDSVTQDSRFSKPEALSTTISEVPQHDLWSKQDFLDCIIKKLWNDRSSLKQCSAASRAFRIACRPRMYNFLDIRLEEDQVPRLQILNEIMSKNEAVVNQLQNLSLSSAQQSPSIDQQSREFLNRFVNNFLGKLLLLEKNSREALKQIANNRRNIRTVTQLPGLRALNIAHLEWPYLENETYLLLIQLLSFVSQLHSFVVPTFPGSIHLIASSFFFNLVYGKASVSHLFYDHTYYHNHHFIKVRSLRIKISDRNNHYLVCLFHLQPPAKLQKNYLKEVEELLNRHGLTEHKDLRDHRLRSLFFLIGSKWENWTSQYHWQAFESNSILQSDSETSQSDSNVNTRFRYLTLGLDGSGESGIDKAFELLCSGLKIHTNDIEVLNLAYPVEAHGACLWSSTQHTLGRADEEFGKISALNILPSLRKINLFLALPDAQPAEWISSSSSLNLSRSENFPGLIRIQNLNYRSLAQVYAPNMYEIGNFSLMAGTVAEGSKEFLERASIKNRSCR